MDYRPELTESQQEKNTDDAANVDLITSIHHRTIQIRKTHQRCADGSIESINYQNPKTFSKCVEHRVASFEDLVAALVAEENSPKSGIVRARYNTEDLGSPRLARRFYRRYEHGGVFYCGPQRHRYQSFDIDELKIPQGMEGDYDAILRYAIAQLPEALRECDYYYQWSGSMGVKPGVIKVHLFTLLDTFTQDAHVRQWIDGYNEQYRQEHPERLTSPSEDLIDKALWLPVQLLTTSPPEFVGMDDPLKAAGVERSGVVRGTLGSVDLKPALDAFQAKQKQIQERRQRERDRELAKRQELYSQDYTDDDNLRWAEAVRDSALDNIRSMSGGSRSDVICKNAKTIGGLVSAGYLPHRQYELEQLIDAARAINPKKANNSASQAKSYFKRGEEQPFQREARVVQTFKSPKSGASTLAKQTPCQPSAPIAPPEPERTPTPTLTPEIIAPETQEEVRAQEEGALDLVDIFQRNYDDAKRVLEGFGRFTLANQCGTGKNTAITRVLVDYPHLLDGMLIAEPTCVKRDEMAREMRAAGLDVREAVTRTSKNCRRLDDLMLASRKSPKGGAELCHACEFNPKGPNYAGDKCTYMTEKARGEGAQIVTHAQLSGILADEERTKPAILILDEATSVEDGHEAINIDQLTKAWNAGDVEIDPQLFNVIRIILRDSEAIHPKTNRPTTIDGIEIARRVAFLATSRPKVTESYNAAQKALDTLLADGVPKTADLEVSLAKIPNYRALQGLSHVEEYGWFGVYAYNGSLFVPWLDPLNTEAIACVVRVDATCTENVHSALGGTQGEWVRTEVKTPEHFEMIRINEGMSKSSGKDGDLSERKKEIWEAAHFGNDGKETLHITHKAWTEREHPMYSLVKQLQGPVIYFGGDEARGSNRYKNVTHVVVDSWHVPKRAITSLAYLLEHRAKMANMDGWEQVDWQREAHFQMLPAEVVQTIQRARLVQASAERQVVVTLLDNRPLEDASPLFRDCVVERPCWYTWLQTGKILHGGRWTAERLLFAALESNRGVFCPTPFFERPGSTTSVDDAQPAEGENTTNLGGFSDLLGCSPDVTNSSTWVASQGSARELDVSYDEKSKNPVIEGVGQPYQISPYIVLGDFSIRLTHTDYEGIRRVLGGQWQSEHGFWDVSVLSSGRGKYALLHTRPVTRDDIRSVVHSAGLGWTVATCGGVRVRMDNWSARVIEAAKILPALLKTATKAILADMLAKSMGESVSTLRRNLKAVGLDLDQMQTLVPSPSPPTPPKPPRKRSRKWVRPSMTSPRFERLEKASQSWDLAALRAKARELRETLRAAGEDRNDVASDLWAVVLLGKLHRAEEMFAAMDAAETFVRGELARVQMAA